MPQFKVRKNDEIQLYKDDRKADMVKDLQGPPNLKGQKGQENGFIEHQNDPHKDGFQALQTKVLNSFREEYEVEPLLTEHVQGLGLVEDLSFTYICFALFVELGWGPSPGDIVSSSSLLREHNLLKGQKRLVGTLLGRLGEREFLKPLEEEGCWEVIQSPPTEQDIREQLKNVQASIQDFPVVAQEAAFANYIGSHLGSVLQGIESGLQILFPDETSLDHAFGAKMLYEKAFTMKYCKVNPTKVGLGVHLEFLFNNGNYDKGSPIRILEIGGGTGGTTFPTLEYLSSIFQDLDFLHYTFTDISNFFVGKAKGDLTAKFPKVKFDFRILDIESPPEAQGFGGQRFDVIIVADVFHATEFLEDTLKHTRDLLKDAAGVLILGEVFKSTMLVETSFGLTDGWWRWGDELRTHGSPCLTPSEWGKALKMRGFRESWAIGDEYYGVVFALAE